MRRVVVTGLGIISPIGNSTQEVVAALREARSGITLSEDHKRLGFRSHVEGSIKVDVDSAVDRRARRFMGDGAAFNYLAMEQAIRDSGLEEKDRSNERTGLIMGSGGPSTKSIVQTADITRDALVALRLGGPLTPAAVEAAASKDDDDVDEALSACDGRYFENDEPIADNLFAFIKDNRAAIRTAG